MAPTGELGLSDVYLKWIEKHIQIFYFQFSGFFKKIFELNLVGDLTKKNSVSKFTKTWPRST